MASSAQSYLFGDGQMEDIFSRNKITSTGTPTPAPSTATPSTGRDGGLTDPQASAIGAGIGAAADITSTIIGATAQSRETQRARDEARSLAIQNRSDTLGQQNIDNRLKAEEQKQQEKSFEIQMAVKRAENRFDDWYSSFQDQLNRTSLIKKAIGDLTGTLQQNPNLGMELVKMWGGKTA